MVMKRRTNINTVFELAKRNIKTQYRGSVLGFIWTILNPLLTMLVMWFVFSSIFGRSAYYPVYLLCGNILFSALRMSSTSALTSIQQNRALLLRTKMDSWIFPCSITAASVFNFFLSLIALVPFMIWLSIDQGLNLFTYRLVFIILMVPAFWMFEYGIGLLLSVLYIFFKDIKNIHKVFILLWQYLTPMFYTIDRIQESKDATSAIIIKVIKINPMYQFVTYLRECIYMGVAGIDPNYPNCYDPVTKAEVILQPYSPVWQTLGILYAWGIVVMLVGMLVHKLVKDKVVLKL